MQIYVPNTTTFRHLIHPSAELKVQQNCSCHGPTNDHIELQRVYKDFTLQKLNQNDSKSTLKIHFSVFVGPNRV